MTLYEVLKWGESYLTEKAIADASVDAWLLLEHVTGISRAVFLAERSQNMGEELRADYEALIQKRGEHIPLQHLTGEQEFMGLSFQVNEHVLIPRQDTEVLVEETLKHLRPGMQVLDLCTGSGCIAVSLAKLWPGGSWKNEPARCLDSDRKNEPNLRLIGALEQTSVQWRQDAAAAGRPLAIAVDAADISEEALKVARENARRQEVPVRYIHSDLFEPLSDSEKADTFCIYDIIVSNPPYIQTAVIEELSEEVRLHEPFGALDGKEDGLYFYRKIIEQGRAYLKKDGWMLFEIGYDQGEAVHHLMEEAGFEHPQVLKDLAGLDRVVCAKYKG